MLKILTENFNFISYGLEIIAAGVGILNFKKFKNTTTKWFIYFLIYVVFVECVGASLVYFKTSPIIKFMNNIGVRSSNWLNLFWMFGSIIFILYYYHAVLKSKRSKQIIILFGIVFLTIFVGYTVFNFNIFLKGHPIIYPLLAACITLFCVALYFIELIINDNIVNAFTTFSFYVSVVFLIWWLIITPTLFFNAYNTIYDWDFVNLKRRIFLFANIFMYLTFTFALIWCRPHND